MIKTYFVSYYLAWLWVRLFKVKQLMVQFWDLVQTRLEIFRSHSCSEMNKLNLTNVVSSDIFGVKKLNICSYNFETSWLCFCVNCFNDSVGKMRRLFVVKAVHRFRRVTLFNNWLSKTKFINTYKLNNNYGSCYWNNWHLTKKSIEVTEIF